MYDTSRRERVVFEAVVGSTMRGFNTDESDQDTVVVFTDPLEKVLSLSGDAPKGKQNHGNDDVTQYELRHYCRLLIKGNPTVYEALNSPIRPQESEFGIVLRENMDKFIDSRAIYEATRGYVHSTTKEANNLAFPAKRRGKKVLASLCVLEAGFKLLKFGEFEATPQWTTKENALFLKSGHEDAIRIGLTAIALNLQALDRAYELEYRRVADLSWINRFLYDVYTAPSEIKTMALLGPMRFVGGDNV